MRAGKLIAAVVLVAALSVAGVAFAGDALTVAFKGSNTATYPNPIHLKITAAEAKPETITVQYRYPGGDWKDIKPSISASRAAEATRYAVPFAKPKMNFEIRAVQGSLESSVATGGVRARLSKLTAKPWAKHDTTMTVRGSISPTHSVDSTVVAVKVYALTTKLVMAKNNGNNGRKPKAVIVRELVGEYPGFVYKNTGGYSFWKAAVPFGAKGVYEIKAVHEDEGHLKSTSKTAAVKIK